MTGDQAWRRIIELFKGDRKVCNCGQAWETVCRGDTFKRLDKEEDDCAGCSTHGRSHGYCRHGCSANQIQAKREVAQRFFDEMEFTRTTHEGGPVNGAEMPTRAPMEE